MSTITHFLPLIFGTGSVVVAGSLIFPKLLGMDSEVLLKISGDSLSSGGGT